LDVQRPDLGTWLPTLRSTNLSGGPVVVVAQPTRQRLPPFELKEVERSLKLVRLEVGHGCEA
jgi:hypothetical protein